MQCCFLNKKNHLQIRFLYLRQNLLESLPGGLLSGKRQLSVLSLDDNGKAVCPGGRRRCSYRLDHFFLFCLLFMVVIPFGPAIRWVTLLLLISCGFSDCLSIATRIWQKHNILRIFTLQRSWKLHEQLLSLFSNCTAQYR